ncbi:MAG: Zn-ribbon domain-containing OB-fold protein [Reyranella sp.]
MSKPPRRGTVHSYTEVYHAIQQAFKQYTPYLVLLVELDTQSGMPTKEAGLRVIGNLTRPDCVLAPRSEVERVGIGARVRMVFTDVAPGLALPQWTIDETAAGGTPWRYHG